MKEREYDVIVYGAGPEGVAAALATAERAERTLLVDDGPDVGGSAVCGLLNHWMGEAPAPLMELLKPLTKKAWGRLIFEPEELSLALRRALKRAGVDLLLNAPAVKAKAKAGRLKSVSFAVGAGRTKLSAWCYVDASQDFTLARLAGCGFEEAEEASIALLARIGGIDTRVPGVFDDEMLRQFVTQFKAEQAVEEIPGELAYPSLVPCLRGGTAILNAAGRGIPLEPGALARTQAETRCREGVLATIGFLQRNVPGYENCYLIQFATQALFLDRPQPLRLRPESPQPEPACDTAEDFIVMTYRDRENPDATVAVPLGNLLSAGAENLLLARAAGMATDQVPLLLAAGDAAGRTAAQSVLYDGSVAKLDHERLRKAMISGYEVV